MLRALIGLLAMACVACGPKLSELKASVDKDAVVVTGHVSDQPIGADVRVSGWGGEVKLPSSDIGPEGNFKVIVPLYELPSGEVKLHVELVQIGVDPLAGDLTVQVPEHAGVAVLGCVKVGPGAGAGTEAAPAGPASRPPAGAPDPATGPLGNVSVQGDSVKSKYPLFCGIDKDGLVSLRVRGPAAMTIKAGSSSTAIDDKGAGVLKLSVTSWLAGISVGGVAARLERSDGKTDWLSSSEAVMKPLKMELSLAAGQAKAATELVIGGDLEKAVDGQDKRATSDRIRTMVDLTRAYMRAARSGKRGGKAPEPGSVLLFDSDRKSDLEGPLIDSGLFVVGPAATLGDISRFANLKQLDKTTPLDACGPYREMDFGQGASDTPTTIPHVRVDVTVEAWRYDGKAVAKETLLGGGSGCPTTVSVELGKAWRDAPPTYTIGGWVLDQDEPG